MATFRELYSIAAGSDPKDFVGRVLCSSVSKRSLLPAKFCVALLGRSFRPERELIRALGATTTLAQFDDELNYFAGRRHLQWWRRKIALRLSIRSLQGLGLTCFKPDQRVAPGAWL
jgi:hypothetical protein